MKNEYEEYQRHKQHYEGLIEEVTEELEVRGVLEKIRRAKERYEAAVDAFKEATRKELDPYIRSLEGLNKVIMSCTDRDDREGYIRMERDIRSVIKEVVDGFNVDLRPKVGYSVNVERLEEFMEDNGLRLEDIVGKDKVVELRAFSTSPDRMTDIVKAPTTFLEPKVSVDIVMVDRAEEIKL